MYTLQFPFTLPADQEIRVTVESFELDGFTASIRKDQWMYVLTIEGFPTSHAARDYIQKVWVGLKWVLLHKGLVIETISWDVEEIEEYAEDPYEASRNLSGLYSYPSLEGPVDAIGNASVPVVYLSGKRVIFFGGRGEMGPTQINLGNILKFFTEGVAFPNSAKVKNDSKLCIALELYAAYFTEISANAKFLTLMMCLEALAEDLDRTKLVIELLSYWEQELNKLQANLQKDSEDYRCLERLKGQVFGKRKKNDSITQAISSLVLNTLQSDGDKDAESLAKRIKEIYGKRSALVHDGCLPQPTLGNLIGETKSIVERVLRARFAQIANTN